MLIYTNTNTNTPDSVHVAVKMTKQKFSRFIWLISNCIKWWLTLRPSQSTWVQLLSSAAIIIVYYPAQKLHSFCHFFDSMSWNCNCDSLQFKSAVDNCYLEYTKSKQLFIVVQKVVQCSDPAPTLIGKYFTSLRADNLFTCNRFFIKILSSELTYLILRSNSVE